VLVNQGAGIFAAPVHQAVTAAAGGGSARPNAIAAADVNGDGELDFAITEGDGGVLLLRANGAGGFTATSRYRSASAPRGVALADLNGDGRPEMIVANHGGGDVSVFTNIAAGSLASEIAYTTGDGPAGIAVGDLSGDGKLDIATANDRPYAGIGLILNTSR